LDSPTTNDRISLVNDTDDVTAVKAPPPGRSLSDMLVAGELEAIYSPPRPEAYHSKNGPIAVRQAKKAIAYGAETDLDTAMILAIEAYNATVVTEDRVEGVRAFNEKRKPVFKGK